MAEPKYNIYLNLARLNDLPPDEAESTFLDCCGSTEWASRMARERPFRMLDDLFTAAEEKWFSLKPAEWLAAFSAHPKIGSKAPAEGQQKRSAEWSGSEQSGMDGAADNVRSDLAEANRLYENKFGFIFIVCASGKTAAEMLAMCRARLGNSVETELRIAAEQQSQITAIRLNKLLER